MLTKKAHGNLPDHHCVRRIDPFLREGRRVSFPSFVSNVDPIDSHDGRSNNVVWRRMDHEGSVGAVKSTRLKELDLAASALLGRGAEDDDLDA